MVTFNYTVVLLHQPQTTIVRVSATRESIVSVGIPFNIPSGGIDINITLPTIIYDTLTPELISAMEVDQLKAYLKRLVEINGGLPFVPGNPEDIAAREQLLQSIDQLTFTRL